MEESEETRAEFSKKFSAEVEAFLACWEDDTRANAGPLNLFQLPEDYPAPEEVFAEKRWLDPRLHTIRGGWGYTRETAAVITAASDFQGICLETMFVKERFREELYRSRMDDEYDLIECEKIENSCQEIDGRRYDNTIYRAAARKMADPLVPPPAEEPPLIRFTAEFWFDITACYGQ